VQRLKEKGCIILGKTNLSQWGHNRDPDAGHAWSGHGGQTYGVYIPEQNPLGSSSGSGSATALGLAFAALGTEVEGSVVSPADRANIVGIKPTIGLVSRDLVLLSRRLGTPGVLSRTVKDGASLLSGIAGRCQHDSDTDNIPFDTIPDYAAACRKGALAGARIGVPRNGLTRYGAIRPAVYVELDKAIEVLRDMGATVRPLPKFAQAISDFGSKTTLVS
jgi:amidase